MAIKVIWGPEGPYAIAETPEEALQLIRLGSKNGSGEALPKTIAEPASTLAKPFEERLSSFWSEINDKAKKFLAGVSKHQGGVRGEVIAAEINMESNSFGGMLGGMRKIANKYNLTLEDIVISEMQSQGTTRFRYFRQGEFFKHLLEKK